MGTFYLLNRFPVDHLAARKLLGGVTNKLRGSSVDSNTPCGVGGGGNNNGNVSPRFTPSSPRSHSPVPSPGLRLRGLSFLGYPHAHHSSRPAACNSTTHTPGHSPGSTPRANPLCHSSSAPSAAAAARRNSLPDTVATTAEERQALLSNGGGGGDARETSMV